MKEEYGGSDFGYLAHIVVIGGGLTRVWISRPLVRRALELGGEPAAPQWQRGAEAEVPAQACLRRTARRAGDERAERRLRRCEHEAAREAKSVSYVVNGSKMWITNGGDADTMSVYAETDINAGANGITAFIIEKGFRSFATSPQRSRMHAGTRQAISTSKRSR